MATEIDTGAGIGGIEGVRAEVDAVIERAGRVAHEGLDPDADSVRVLAGLVLQLAEQVGRMLSAPVTSAPSTAQRSPNEAGSQREEDASPEEGPAEPAREV